MKVGDTVRIKSEVSWARELHGRDGEVLLVDDVTPGPTQLEVQFEGEASPILMYDYEVEAA